MLKELAITNYRQFSSYKMEGLAHVNLLVGKNNSGKTSILEAVQLLTSGGDPSAIALACRRRGELLIEGRGPSLYAETAEFADIRRLFRGHSFDDNSSFSVGGSGHPKVTVTVQATAPLANGRDTGLRSLVITVGQQALAPLIIVASNDGVEYERGIESIGFIGARRNERLSLQFIGNESMRGAVLAALWDEIAKSGQEDDVRQALRVIEPKLESISPLTGIFANNYLATNAGFVLGITGHKERIPLGTAGEGMRRLLVLASGLACAKGSLFIDEIDTGLHYLVMPEMWKLVVSKAVDSKIQVFATTHSWDCVEGLSQFCESNPKLSGKVAIHKIDRAISHSIAFTGESIVGMVKADIDPR
jgi:hypothetical protein